MSEPRAAGPLLWVRAGLLGSIGLLTGVVSHAAADGLLPSVGSLLALVALSTFAAAWFLRRRTSGPMLVVLSVAAQSAVHLALSVLAGHRGESPAAPVLAPAPTASWEDALMGGYADAPVRADLGWTGHALDHVTAVGPWMLLAHVAGAVALGAWLGVGEAALWSLLLLLGCVVLARVAARPLPVVRRSRTPGCPALGVDLRPTGLVAGSVSRRGPPVPVC